MKDQYAFPHQPGTPPGMELRDWFAGMAMQAFVTRYGTDMPVAEIATAAFVVADGMETFREMTFDEICNFADNNFQKEEQD